MGESAAEYWSRKHDELALLGRAAGVPAATVTSGAGLWREKQRLRALMLQRNLDASLTESNFHRGDRDRLVYGYQRFDLRVRTRRFFSDVYALDARGGPSLGVWGASGMGVITAALRVLDGNLEVPRRLLFAPDCYFETRGLIPRLQNLLPNDDDDQLLDGDYFLLDSVTAEDRFPLLLRGDLSRLRLVLFDTTCYDAGSPLVDRVVALCHQQRVPLLLLRSHLKLDCLATEYARLGSAVLWLPPRPSTALVAFARRLRLGMMAELVRAGATLQPWALFPLAGDATFQRLNALKNARMVETQARAAEALRQMLPSLTAPHHGLYLVIDPRVRSEYAVHGDKRALAARLSAAGIEALAAPSFGYDVVGLTVLPRALTSSLRLALPDLPDEDVDRLVEIVTGYYQH